MKLSIVAIIVVYLLIPTSNHNLWYVSDYTHLLYIFWFLHQTTTLLSLLFKYDLLYIFWFLHQTTTIQYLLRYQRSCISFDSYIKPQLSANAVRFGSSCISFDSYIKPQPSSGKSCTRMRCISFDSYIKPQLSRVWTFLDIVVYLLIPTSNHNFDVHIFFIYVLYIFWFLHQTTTWLFIWATEIRCISFDSYIKPQRKWCQKG